MAASTRFGWQGFELCHPDEWCPISLTGTRREGYACIASAGAQRYQIRWKEAKTAGDLRARLASYFNRLGRDARKAKEFFTQQIDEADGRITYKWLGAGQGRGMLFYNEPCRRVFFLETLGTRKDSLLPLAQGLYDTFTSGKQDTELWSLYGLAVRLPAGLRLESQKLMSGHTKLSFRGKRASIECQRWAFGEQLADKHGLEPWARAVLRLPRSAATLAKDNLELKGKHDVALIRLQREENQIQVLYSRGRNPDLKARWEWLV